MLIDWFTVGAQVLNFVLLVWLMKRFFYRPVLTAIAVREKRIADQIAGAAAKDAQAATERKTFKDKSEAFDQQRADLLSKATADANAERVRLTDEARNAAAAVAVQREQSLATQAGHLRQLIAGRAAHQVFAVARKTLADLADVSLEERIVDVFMRRLGELADPDRSELGTALKQGAEPALVRSRFALTTDQQAAIQNAIKAIFSAEVPLRFDTAGDAVCGIELSAGGRKLAWTIAEYLGDLEHEVATLLEPAAKVVPATKSVDVAAPDGPSTPRAEPVAA